MNFVEELELVENSIEELITEEYMKKIIQSIEWKEDETIHLTDLMMFSRLSEPNLEFNVTFEYKNKRTAQTYQVRVVKNQYGAYPDYEAYTIIKNTKTGKHVDRTTNTTRVTDKLLFAICTQLKTDTNFDVSPDITEIKRFFKFLGANHQCYDFSIDYFLHLKKQLGIQRPNDVESKEAMIHLIRTLIHR